MKNHPERLKRLFEVNRDLGLAADTNEYLNGILVAAAELTQSEGAAILEFDDQAKHLRFLALAGLDQKALEALETVTVPLEGSVAGTAFASVKPVMLSDVQKVKYHFKNADKISGFQTKSILAVPIQFQGEVLGVFEVLNKPTGSDYTGDDATILETLSVQAAVAIQNVRLQRLLTQTQGDAERLNRMKSDFIAITSHELRTPLGLILGHSTFLREVIGEDFHPQMDTIIRNAMRLKEIIENMTNADNAETGMALVRRRSTSIKNLLKEMVTNFAEDAKSKHITIKADVGEDDLMIEGDTEKIGIAISSLIKNAISFTNEKGHIFLVAERVPGYVKVSVIDDGIGIPADALPHVFERFFQVESHLTRKHGGMGLGLSVAKMMVEMHGGRIWAESVSGKGSNFTMLLPLDSSQAEALGKVFTD